MLFCVENITTYNYEDPLRKRENVISFDIGTLAYSAQELKDGDNPVKTNNLDYAKPGQLHADLNELRKREIKAELKERMVDSLPRSRSRKKVKQHSRDNQHPLEELRQKRKKMVTVMY